MVLGSESEPAAPKALAIEGRKLARAVADLGVTHVVIVPDTNLKSAISALHEYRSLQIIYACTEDEAMGINAGLYMAGRKPMLLVQNNGLFACVNTLKSIALDACVPTFMLIGQYGRDVTKDIESNRLRAVRLLEPTLAVWDVPSFRIDKDEDLPALRTAWDLCRSRKGPTAAVVGAPTN